MGKMFLLKITVVFLLGNFFYVGKAQEKTSSDSLFQITPEINKKVRKNTILINVTNPLLISTRFQAIGYERILPHNQSFTVNIGTFSIPKFMGELADSLGLDTDNKDKGFHFSTDYRFYLKKENKYAAPHGVYIGPFYTFNYLNRENSWHVDGYVDEVFTNLKLGIHTMGVELGYQFVFWDRMAVDMVLLGPGLGVYSLSTEIGTNMNADKESEFFNKLNEILAEKIPGYDKVIESGEFKRKGSYNTVDIGFRYVVRVGYRF